MKKFAGWEQVPDNFMNDIPTMQSFIHETFNSLESETLEKVMTMCLGHKPEQSDYKKFSTERMEGVMDCDLFYYRIKLGRMSFDISNNPIIITFTPNK